MLAVVDAVANVPRADLPKAGVAPNPEHGFVVSLPPATVKALQSGMHRVEVYASGSAEHCGQYAWKLPYNGAVGEKHCVDNGTYVCTRTAPLLWLMILSRVIPL